MNMNNVNTVFIIDDNAETCSALYCLFEEICFNVETFDSARKFLDSDHSSRRGCIITDVRMPEMSGLELLEQLRHENNTMPAIMMTGYGDIPMAVKAMKSGAVDFIVKPVNGQDLLKIVEQHLKPSLATSSSKPDTTTILTKREQEVMNLILDGRLNKQIASELNISISTVEAHRAKIVHKYHAKNLAQLIKIYFQISR